MSTRVLPVVLVAMTIAFPRAGRAQSSGNVAFSRSSAKAAAEQQEQSKRVLGEREQPPTATSMFVEANVLLNVKADEYVAVFGVAQEADSALECGRKLDAVVKTFMTELKALGVRDGDVYVDFVAQHRIYGFEVKGDVAREKLTGFELKKNVAIRYQDHALLDKLVAAAAKAQIFDLIKVDYIVKDTAQVQNQLAIDVARVVKAKTARYEKLLGIKLLPMPQVYIERSAVHFPTQLYDSYVAAEGERLEAFDRNRFTIQSVRKSSTIFYNGLDGNGFDDVINPDPVEPAVQYTLYLKLKYDMEPLKDRR